MYQADSEPVFITGIPRSGTTLLYRTLLKHSSFKPKNLCLEETKIFLQPHLAIKSDQWPESLCKYMLKDESVYQQYIESIHFEIFWQKLCQKLRLSFFVPGNHVYWQIGLNARIARKYFHYAKRARNCNRIVEKTPQHLLITQRILKSFPRSKIIVLMRHPVDVFSSYKKRKQIDTNSKWLKISIEEFVEKYSEMSDRALNLFDQNKALCVKYEDFISDPKKEFSRISSYVEEPYEQEPVMVDEPRLDYWKIDPYLSKTITKETKKWSDYLEADQAQFIEDNLKDQMEIFGYKSKLS